jgi:hypothetical protein
MSDRIDHGPPDIYVGRSLWPKRIGLCDVSSSVRSVVPHLHSQVPYRRDWKEKWQSRGLKVLLCLS